MTALTLSSVLVNSLTGDDAWYASQFHNAVTIAVVLYFLFRYIPYGHLESKTIVAVWFSVVVTDVLLYPLWYFGYYTNPIAAYLKFTVAVLMLIHVFWRSYRVKSDTLGSGHIYMVRRIPDGPQDLFLSLFFRKPVGGTGVALNGYWYHFHRGELVKHSVSRIPTGKYVIIRIRNSRSCDHEMLTDLIGVRWTWKINCMTVLYPLARWGRTAPWTRYYSGN